MASPTYRTRKLPDGLIEARLFGADGRSVRAGTAKNFGRATIIGREALRQHLEGRTLAAIAMAVVRKRSLAEAADAQGEAVAVAAADPEGWPTHIDRDAPIPEPILRRHKLRGGQQWAHLRPGQHRRRRIPAKWQPPGRGKKPWTNRLTVALALLEMGDSVWTPDDFVYGRASHIATATGRRLGRTFVRSEEINDAGEPGLRIWRIK